MKLSDFIVEFLISKKITDVFGYPGGMVTHLIDSLDKYKDLISTHLTYHEQGASFAACGYAQVSRKPGVAFATSGPGATNLITGIANAYFDSIPTIFITGQVNTHECKKELKVRQKGFQETDIVAMTQHITKYSKTITNPYDILYYLEEAYFEATNGRPGAVLLDIPMDIQRSEINPNELHTFSSKITKEIDYNEITKEILNQLQSAKRPCIIIGAGVRQSGSSETFVQLSELLKIPVVSSMLAVDILPNSLYYYGFLGAYGHRYANFIVSKSDLIISIGSRLDIRQTGGKVENFAPNAKLVRIDIDPNELTHKIKRNEIDYIADISLLVNTLLLQIGNEITLDFSNWISVCNILKSKLSNADSQTANLFVEKLSEYIPSDNIITTDVGQNQIWVAQSFKVNGQTILFSGGHGSMGYSLPAAIGAYYASKKPVVSFNGDGGFQMNIQELQFIFRENLPIKIIVINNKSLGMIRHFQEMYFNSNYVQTKPEKGYLDPDFTKIATAYGINSIKIHDDFSKLKDIFNQDGPLLVEFIIEENTYVFPKLEYGKPNEDQEPLIDRTLYKYLSDL